jgi:hypothetical protein
VVVVAAAAAGSGVPVPEIILSITIFLQEVWSHCSKPLGNTHWPWWPLSTGMCFCT